MTKLSFTITLLLVFITSNIFWNCSEAGAQNVAITDDDTYNADPSAMLDVKSLSKGMLVPRLTTVQRNSVSNPATGLLVFDTNEGSFYFYNGTSWTNLSSGNANGVIGYTASDKVYLKDINDKFGIGTVSPSGKLDVKSDASIGIERPIFNVVNSTGDTVFAVYEQGVRINVYDDPTAKATANKGGFAVGGFSPAKGTLTNEYLRITPDSVRIYIEEGNVNKATANKGGFAVGGFSPAKSTTTDYFNIYGSDATTTLNPSEARIFWYPLKEAFLTGRVLVESPDSVGTNSFASGFESKAIGNYSQALGYQAIAKGNYSTAIGKNSLARNNSSFAFGANTKALAESAYSFGYGSIASGFGSYAMGSQGIDSSGIQVGDFTLASGDFSMAFGHGSKASNLGSMSFGISNTSSGNHSQAFGYNTVANGTYSTSFGSYTNATGYASTAMGDNNTSSGLYSFSSGCYNTSSGYASTVINVGNLASGNYSLATGYLTKARGENSFSAGIMTEANATGAVAIGGYSKATVNFSLATGYATNANAQYSTTMGGWTTANSYSALVIGRYNDTTVTQTYSRYNWYDGDPLFVCGNGSYGATSNAFTVLKNGNTGVGKASPNEKLDVAGNIRLNDNSIFLRGGTDTNFGIKYVDNFASLSISGPLIYSYWGGALAAVGPDRVALKWDYNGNIWMPFVYNIGVGATNRDLYIDNTGLIGYISSSKRYKKNISNMENVNWLYNLRPVNYTYKTDSLSKIQYGLIAEEVEKINPHFVSYNNDGTVETVNYSKLISPMLKAIQDLKSENEILKNKISELDKLKTEFEVLKAYINASAKK